jgi:hypothetical protein
MAPTKFPTGWDEDRVQRVLAHYESQTDEQAAAEDEAAADGRGKVRPKTRLFESTDPDLGAEDRLFEDLDDD